MDHYLVYHNPDVMGKDASEVEEFALATTKPVTKALGGTVWVITGRGSPRRYSLVKAFVAEYADEAPEDSRVSQVSAKSGIRFNPEIRLDDLPWFPEFRRSMGNFGLGFQKIGDPRFVAALEAVAAPRVRAPAKPAIVRRRPMG